MFIGQQMWSSNRVHSFIYCPHLSCSQSRGRGVPEAIPSMALPHKWIFFYFSTDQIINREIVVSDLCGLKPIILSKCGSSSLLDWLCRFPNSFDDLCYFPIGSCSWVKLIWVKSDLLKLAFQMIGGNSDDYFHEKITDFIFGRFLPTLYLLSNNKLSPPWGLRSVSSLQC